MIEQRPGQKQFVVPGPDWGIRVIEPGPQAAGGGWWDDFGSIGCCLAAYQGRGAADYPTSLINLANPGVNDLTDPAGAPAWNAVQGWFNFAALLAHLDTGLVPAADQSWSALVQFANEVGNNQYLFGMSDGVAMYFAVQPLRGGVRVGYHNGNLSVQVPQLATGNLGVAGNQGYRNGVADGPAIGPWGGASTRSILIGAINFLGAPQSWTQADIWAVSLYDCTLTVPQMAAVAANMAAL